MSVSSALGLPAAQPLPPKGEPNTGFIKEEEPAPDTELPRAAANALAHGPEEVRPERRAYVPAIRAHLVCKIGAAMYFAARCTCAGGCRCTVVHLCVNANLENCRRDEFEHEPAICYSFLFQVRCFLSSCCSPGT